jgi:predicted ATPase with chaperone activity
MVEKLAPETLRRRCDPRIFSFSSTEEIEPLSGIIGQERALEALRLGLSLKAPKSRHNVYVAGEPGLGKTSAGHPVLGGDFPGPARPAGYLLRP